MGAAPTTPAAPAAAPPLALVVADDPRSRLRAARLLGAAGLTIALDGHDDGAGEELATALVILASTVPAIDRVHAIEEAAARRPGALIVAAMNADATGTQLRRALRGGAMGIVLDNDVERALVATVRAVLAGQLVVPPGLGRRIAPRALSHREKQILRLVVLGYTNRQIADHLFVAPSTVKTHLSSAFAKLDAHSRAEATALILDPEEGLGLGILPVAVADPQPNVAPESARKIGPATSVDRW